MPARAGAVLLVSLLLPGFGTIEGGGQHREHERITRAALACPAGRGPDAGCFQPVSMDQLAGDGRGFGAVGAPDRTEVSVPAAHCDDADFLAGDYPRTRDQATATIGDCVAHLRRRFQEAVRNAGALLDEQGGVIAAEARLDTACRLEEHGESRAKCTALESFGRALHGVQDFYAHSSWADEADPARPIGADNPPGLNRPAPSPVLDLRGTGAPSVPHDLSTGCFVLQDRVPGVGNCERRVTHAALNKDNGLIDPVSGSVTSPGTPRGQVGRNFEKAVTGAIVETRHQWQELRDALRGEYGARRASMMTCALTRDDPADDCRGAGVGRTVAWVLVVLILFLGFAALLLRWRGRRRRFR
ncbi:CinY protein [Actinoplanes aureus]|uniref:CinY protein n=1 Tax=Actinoplanes aureus TaxID=2792083 RepID=A0A931FXN2_9ACTN|nr:CinY protein [Actinoplanes aureus]MBG0563743.1 CinY protein [Actinoplanes aureus]